MLPGIVLKALQTGYHFICKHGTFELVTVYYPYFIEEETEAQTSCHMPKNHMASDRSRIQTHMDCAYKIVVEVVCGFYDER